MIVRSILGKIYKTLASRNDHQLPTKPLQIFIYLNAYLSIFYLQPFSMRNYPFPPNVKLKKKKHYYHFDLMHPITKFPLVKLRILPILSTSISDESVSHTQDAFIRSSSARTGASTVCGKRRGRRGFSRRKVMNPHYTSGHSIISGRQTNSPPLCVCPPVNHGITMTERS